MDLIETYKILKGLDKLDAGRLFPMLWESRTRGHSLKGLSHQHATICDERDQTGSGGRAEVG